MSFFFFFGCVGSLIFFYLVLSFSGFFFEVFSPVLKGNFTSPSNGKFVPKGYFFFLLLPPPPTFHTRKLPFFLVVPRFFFLLSMINIL